MIGVPNVIKGTVPVAFVTFKSVSLPNTASSTNMPTPIADESIQAYNISTVAAISAVQTELVELVRARIGAIASLKQVHGFTFW